MAALRAAKKIKDVVAWKLLNADELVKELED